MEQQVLRFTGNPQKKSAILKAKKRSQELAEEGWFVHDTCATGYWNQKFGLPFQEVMVTYRRDGKTPVTPYESPSTHEAQPALRIVVCPHCDKQIRVTHESNVLVNCPLCNQQFKTP